MSTRIKLDPNQIVYPYAIRNSYGTSSTSMSDGVLNNKECLNRETKIVDPDTNYYNDILMVYGTNSSDQAIRLSVYENYGGSKRFTLQMAASSTNEITFPVPFPASEKGSCWYADYEVYGGVTDADDVTNTDVKLSINYIKNL